MHAIGEYGHGYGFLPSSGENNLGEITGSLQGALSRCRARKTASAARTPRMPNAEVSWRAFGSVRKVAAVPEMMTCKWSAGWFLRTRIVASGTLR